MILIIGYTFSSVPPAARSLAVIVAVYTIMLAAKQNTWVANHVKGWYGVAFNTLLTILGVLVVVPADQLYSINTIVAVAVSVLGSSGIHGMSKSIPPTK